MHPMNHGFFEVKVKGASCGAGLSFSSLGAA
jgi:hypothetical protein